MKLLRTGLAFAFILLVAGCQGTDMPLQSDQSPVAGVSKIVLPPGSSLVSATLVLYTYPSTGAALSSIHRVNKGWDELTVSWPSFITSDESDYQDGAFKTFTPVADPALVVKQEIDVKAVVLEWLSGTPNYGMLLKWDFVPNYNDWTVYYSSENTLALRPSLILVYNNGNGDQTIEIKRGVAGVVQDAYIRTGTGTTAFGATDPLILCTGWGDGWQKMTLIKFDLPACTWTIGYWKTHGPTPTGNNTNMWPVSGLTLGSVPYTNAQLLTILNTPVKGNGLLALAHQLIGAKLNIAKGALGPQVLLDAIAAADALIGSKSLPGTSSMPPSATSALVTILTAYNEGTMAGVSHCD